MQGKFAHILQMNESEITEAVNSLSEQEAKELLIIILQMRKRKRKLKNYVSNLKLP